MRKNWPDSPIASGSYGREGGREGGTEGGREAGREGGRQTKYGWISKFQNFSTG